MFSLKTSSEQAVLVISAVGAGFFAVAALTWGVFTGSLAILFDGAYSFISLALSLLSLLALKLARAPADSRFNFGRPLAEPLAIAFKALVLMLLCLGSLGLAFTSIIAGGRTLVAGLAVGFALVSVVGCALIWLILHQRQKELQSSLVEAESKQWFMDTLLSGAILLGFSLAWVLDNLGYSQAAAYADPVMVILASSYFLQMPIKMLRQALGELLLASPEPQLRHQVYREVAVLGIHRSQCRMAHFGNHLLLEVELSLHHIAGLQLTVEKVAACLESLPIEPLIRLNVSQETSHS
jgi:cation diffusion facilitator family transporter